MIHISYFFILCTDACFWEFFAFLYSHPNLTFILVFLRIAILLQYINSSIQTNENLLEYLFFPSQISAGAKILWYEL